MNNKMMKELIKAANEGDVEAQSNLGGMYESDGYVKKALFWHFKAAKKGNYSSQLSLGLIYSLGKRIANGVEKDDEMAIYWYLKAAKQGGAVSISVEKYPPNSVE